MPAQSYICEVPCFIVGMSRGGTTWLTKLLNAHSDCVALGETTFWGRGYIKPASEDLRYTEAEFFAAKDVLLQTQLITCGDGVGCFARLTQLAWESRVRDISYKGQTPCELFDAAMNAACLVEEKSRWVEKTPHHLNSIDRIISSYPNAKFIVQVRDPYGFMSSYKYQGERKQENAKRYFRRLYHPIACSILWKRYFRQSVAVAKKYPEYVQLLKFDDLKVAPKSVYARVLDFLDLAHQPFPEGVQDKNSSFNQVVQRKLSNADVFWMNALASREIDEIGAVKQQASVFSFSVLKSILTLPIWFFWLLGPVRRKVKVPFFRYIWKWGKGV